MTFCVNAVDHVRAVTQRTNLQRMARGARPPAPTTGSPTCAAHSAGPGPSRSRCAKASTERMLWQAQSWRPI